MQNLRWARFVRYTLINPWITLALGWTPYLKKTIKPDPAKFKDLTDENDYVAGRTIGGTDVAPNILGVR